MPVEFSTEPLLRLARHALGGAAVVQQMPGGASLRRFFRVTHAGKSAVGMFFPDALGSEEASASAQPATRWPFLEVRDLLAARGIDVPALLGEACDAGWVLVEDLGDDTLAEVLLRKPDQKLASYQRVVLDLASAHDALGDLPKDSVVARRAFEPDLLEWEIDHFREWALEARGFQLTQEQRGRFARLARELAEQVRALPYGFTHRDFQSRNLMLCGNRVVWVDFQDALMGPRVYDLVALLGDSYQSFDDGFVRDRLAEYTAARGITPESDAIRREFDLVTVQRKLKDAGRFVFIENKKGDASYLRFVEPTILLVRRTLERLQNDACCRELGALLAEVL
jgi:hypothetical protein